MHLYREIYIVILLFASNFVYAEDGMLDELSETKSAELCYALTKHILNYTNSLDNELKAYKVINHTQHYQLDQLSEKMKVSEEKLFNSLSNLTNTENQLQSEREKVEVIEKELSKIQLKLNNTENQLRTTHKKLNLTEEKLFKIQIQLKNTEKSLYETQFKLNNTEKRLQSEMKLVNETEDTDLLYEKCEKREKKFEKIGDKYYYIEKSEQLTWFDAAMKCANWNSHLAIPQTDLEWTNLMPKLSADDRYWIDLIRLGNRKFFLSETTGKTLKLDKWLPDEPNNDYKMENCAEIRFGEGLNDAPCEFLKYFICESNNEYGYNCKS
ncbi:low affinity immunoglobulin epsilon Fc receptor-like [Drosophila willistoni]|uniref:low affinity immunoglobulin epsilon Fc receptor-like n=1 Tax=Drosophila willistoni TaxID=7260 RepID=UPI001F07A553|nr:low affinity immunoglobulin epsilon Fc receptor-like [Drosophila willistoni]